MKQKMKNQGKSSSKFVWHRKLNWIWLYLQRVNKTLVGLKNQHTEQSLQTLQFNCDSQMHNKRGGESDSTMNQILPEFGLGWTCWQPPPTGCFWFPHRENCSWFWIKAFSRSTNTGSRWAATAPSKTGRYQWRTWPNIQWSLFSAEKRTWTPEIQSIIAWKTKAFNRLKWQNVAWKSESQSPFNMVHALIVHKLSLATIGPWSSESITY